MNFKQYHETESKKTYWHRERDLNKRLITKRTPWKEQVIRGNFEIEITRKANPKAWLFVACLMGYAMLLLLVAAAIMIVVQLGYIPLTNKSMLFADTLLMFSLIGLCLTAGVYGIVTRRRRK